MKPCSPLFPMFPTVTWLLTAVVISSFMPAQALVSPSTCRAIRMTPLQEKIHQPLETAWLKDFVTAEETRDAEGTFLLLASEQLFDEDKLAAQQDRPDGSVRFVVRDVYRQLADEIAAAIATKQSKRVFVTGTRGTGKTTFRNYVAWKLLRAWRAQGKEGAVVMHKGGREVYTVLAISAEGEVEAWKGDNVEISNLTGQYKLGETLVCLTDASEGDIRGVEDMSGGLVLFSSPNPKTWASLGKQSCKYFFMPLWTLEELMYCDPSTPTGRLIEDRFFKYGGLARYVWGSEEDIDVHEDRLTDNESMDQLFERLQKKLREIKQLTRSEKQKSLSAELIEDGLFVLGEQPARIVQFNNDFD
ncbi:hypothetical protein B484DRAFT_439621, partial [Ochromonadaceae sp. CCMP2298]